jgi:hypothetical protein
VSKPLYGKANNSAAAQYTTKDLKGLGTALNPLEIDGGGGGEAAGQAKKLTRKTYNSHVDDGSGGGFFYAKMRLLADQELR